VPRPPFAATNAPTQEWRSAPGPSVIFDSSFCAQLHAGLAAIRELDASGFKDLADFRNAERGRASLAVLKNEMVDALKSDLPPTTDRGHPNNRRASVTRAGEMFIEALSEAWPPLAVDL
jgi:hypothetical protein